MRINKITSKTPDRYVVQHLRYYRVDGRHIIFLFENWDSCTTFKEFRRNTSYEKINKFIYEYICIAGWDVKDKGDYWQITEVFPENLIQERFEEVERIEEIIAKAIDSKQPQPFDEGDAYEIDIEYLEEGNNNLFEAAVVLKYCNNPERYFPIKENYNSISNVFAGKENIIYEIAEQIYTYYYGDEEDIEEE